MTRLSSTVSTLVQGTIAPSEMNAAFAAAASKRGVTATASPGEWTITVAAAVNVTATVTKAAGGAGVRHVLTSLRGVVNAVAAQTTPLVLVVRDGATTAGTILWQSKVTALIGTDGVIDATGLSIVGSANTAMCIEFTAAGTTNNFETISGTGYSVTA